MRTLSRTPEAAIRLVSQALFDTFTFSRPHSFLAGCPKTCLCYHEQVLLGSNKGNTHRYLDALTNRDISGGS